jgi:hypothetical protein
VPALRPYIIEPIFEQVCALLLPEREANHPLGCHRPRTPPDCVLFEKLVQVLVFGCAHWRIADESCSATTLRRRRRDEWIEIGAMEAPEKPAREAYDRAVGLDLFDVAVDCCITKAPRGGEKAGKSPVDRAKRGLKRSMAVDALGIPLLGWRPPPGEPPRLAAFGAHCWRPWRLPHGVARGCASVHLGRAYDSRVIGGLLKDRGMAAT